MYRLLTVCVLLAIVNIKLTSSQDCGSTGNWQIPIMQEYHKGMNLTDRQTLDCNIVGEAVDAAVNELVHSHPQYFSNSTTFCRYSRQTWWRVWDDFNKDRIDYLFNEMPKDKIKQTAKKHEPTKYGCSAVRHKFSRHDLYYYVRLICLYRKTNGQECR